MFFTTRALALATLTTLALAQEISVFTFPFYGYDSQTIDASVIASDSTATTFSLACPSATSTDSEEDCGLAPTQTMTVGPSIYKIVAIIPGEFTGTQDCITSGTTGAVCTETNSGGNDPGTATVTYSESDVELLGVTVTAGSVDGGVGAATSMPASTSASLTTIEGTNTPATTSGTQVTGSSSGASAASPTSTGAAMRGGEAVGVIAGLAGLVALAV